MQHDSQTYEDTFFFDPDDPIYKDHFPGQPVVPGSLIVQAFIKALSTSPCNFEVAKVENFRFKRFVAPGTHVYRMVYRPNGPHGPAWRCSLFDGDRLAASGVLA